MKFNCHLSTSIQKICIIIIIIIIFISLWILTETNILDGGIVITSSIPYTYISPFANNITIDNITAVNININDDYIKYLSLNPHLYDRINKLGNDTIIHENPMFDDECKNALIYKENIDIDKLKKECLICNNGEGEEEEEEEEIIWSRELLDAIQTKSKIYWQSEAVRIPLYDDTIIKSDFEINTNDTKLLPTYYMIAKCGSSTIFTILDTIFNKKIVKTTMHKSYTINNLNKPISINTNCGFTFVRNPITRLISGYYTINRKIFGIYKTFNNSTQLFINAGWNNQDNLKKGWNFLSINGEPQRFIAFVEEMINNPYKFTHIDPMSHVTSILSKSFGVFYGSNIQFIGKMEYFNNHWNKLMNYCPWFNQHINNDKIKRDKNGNIYLKKPLYAMWQYGKSSVRGEYNNVLGVNISKILPTAYYIIANNKTLYDSLVNYYWQDFICFGYKPDFKQFQQYVKDFEIATYRLTHP